MNFKRTIFFSQSQGIMSLRTMANTNKNLYFYFLGMPITTKYRNNSVFLNYKCYSEDTVFFNFIFKDFKFFKNRYLKGWSIEQR